MSLFLTLTQSTSETECYACEPGGLAYAFLRTSGFGLATTLDQFSITFSSSWQSWPDWTPSGVFSCPSKASRVGCSYDRLQAISPDTGFLPKIVHLVIRCRAVVHDTCKSLN